MLFSRFRVTYRLPKVKEETTMWMDGIIEVADEQENLVGVRYYIKRFDTPSEYGIEEGRISKLELRLNKETVCNYDRGWDIEPTCTEAEIALELLLEQYN